MFIQLIFLYSLSFNYVNNIMTSNIIYNNNIDSNIACTFGLSDIGTKCGYLRSNNEYNTTKVGGTNFKLFIHFG